MHAGSIQSTEGQRSFDELGTPLREVTFCVLDLETTGGNRNEDMITEIGAVKVRGGECLGTYQTLVNPGRAIPAQISVLTGLTDALVSTAPRVEAVLPSLLEFIGDSVFVGHNVGFDLGFLRAALQRAGRPRWEGTVVDTVALARRLVRDEVPDCKLGTLASRLRLDHRPSHRALDDALATTDLLHLLLERAAGHGVLGLDDLCGLAKLAGHPQAAKLKMTTHLPRTPGVYMFRDHEDRVLYVGKATNIRQRVRSYFGSDDRRKIGPLLRETRSISHLELSDPLTAEVIETRLISQLLPRYNRRGTRTDRYCYVRLDDESPWPRLAVVKKPGATGVHLGPLTSRSTANALVDALHDALPLRRCSTRLGPRYTPPVGASLCTAAQLGVAQCPCSGAADRSTYDAAVEQARRALGGETDHVVEILHAQMARIAAQQRYEEAASIRDRLSALLGAARRHALVEALRRAGRCRVRLGDTIWFVEDAQLIDATRDGSAGSALPVEPPPPSTSPGPLRSDQIDEALCLARFFDEHAPDMDVRCSGEWKFPVSGSAEVPPLARVA